MKKILTKFLPLGIVVILLIWMGAEFWPKLFPTRTAEEKVSDLIASENTEVAYFGSGCFWCTESDFEKVDGVLAVISGYMGGTVENPTYKQVSAGQTGHREIVQIIFDSEVVSYAELLDHFWHHVDPTDSSGQFVDRGNQYVSVIFYTDETQKELAETSKQELENSGVFENPVITPILPAGKFYAAEDYHQDYYKKNPVRYEYYRSRSGRDQFLEEVWGEKTRNE